MSTTKMMILSAIGCAMLLPMARVAAAQGPGSAVNEPVIDLAGAAKRVREGQVVPPEGPEGSQRVGGENATGGSAAGADRRVIIPAPLPAPEATRAATELLAGRTIAGERTRVVAVESRTDAPARAQVRRLLADGSAGSGAWSDAAVMGEFLGGLEVRTGAVSTITLALSDGTQVRLERLTRARVMRLEADGARPAMTLIEVSRGAARVDPGSEGGPAVNVATPERLVEVRSRSRVRVDAVNGTQVQRTDEPGASSPLKSPTSSSAGEAR
jgi:hypothetical protein